MLKGRSRLFAAGHTNDVKVFVVKDRKGATFAEQNVQEHQSVGPVKLDKYVLPSKGCRENERMKPHFISSYGSEFIYEELPLGKVDGSGDLLCLQAAVGIEPKSSKEETLSFAWDAVREQATWLLSQSDRFSIRLRYQIVVAWSRSVRNHRGQIFKILGDLERLDLVIKSESYQDYSKIVPDNWVPLPGWEKDVFGRE